MDETIKRRLRNDFGDFTCSTAGARLHMQTNWRARTPGVSKVEVRLEGVEPLTGRKLPQDYLVARFDRLTAEYRSQKLPLYGNYTLSFEAFDELGSLGVFRRMNPLRIENTEYCPQMSYSMHKEESGWSRLELRTNYLERVRGRLWLEYDRRRYLLVNGSSTKGDVKLCLYVPASDVRIIQEDKSLPEPRRR